MNFTIIEKQHIELGDKLNFNLYSVSNITTYSLLLAEAQEVTEPILEKINFFKNIYVKSSELFRVRKFYLNKKYKKREAIYENASSSVLNIFSSLEEERIVSETEIVVSNLIKDVVSEDTSMQALLNIMNHDYYTHTHSLNVAIYALSLGMALNFSKEDLKRLGLSGLLHDLGKRKISIEIINKPGKLDDKEFAIMKLHPIMGLKLARKIQIEDVEILGGIYEHHEKFSGHGGYPGKVTGMNISLFGRIIAIADIFDALTTKRSYKDAMTSYDALELMKTNMRDNVDFELLKLFISIFDGNAIIDKARR